MRGSEPVADAGLRRPHIRLDLFKASAGLCLAVAVLYLLMLVLGPDPRGPQAPLVQALDTFFLSVVGLAALAGMVATAKAAHGRVRLGWLLLSTALVGMTVYEALYIGAIARGDGDGFFWVGTGIFAVLIPLAVVSLVLLHPRRMHAWALARIALDGILVAGSLLFLAWALFLGHAYHVAPGTVAQRLVAISYPVLDVVLASVAIILLIDAPTSTRDSLWLLAGGMCAFAFADVVTTYQSLVGTYAVGVPTDAVYMVGMLLLALATLKPNEWRNLPREDGRPIGLIGSVIPVLPAIAGLPVAAMTMVRNGGMDLFLMSIGLFDVLIVQTRLLFVIFENHVLASGLRTTSKFKTDLLRFVSHEVANPLTPIRLQVALLERAAQSHADLSPKSFQILDRNIARLELLTHDVMDLSRVEAGRFSYEPQPVDLATLARQAFDVYEPQARAKGVRLRLDASGAVPASADPQRIGQVLDNLLSNAVKFTPHGEVVLRVLGNGQDARIEVIDSGVGLSKEQIAGLFQPFGRVHNGHSIAGGNGLGLYICQGIVSQHGGRLWAESDGPEKGARFVFTMPRLEIVNT